jgi:hypothetical protein
MSQFTKETQCQQIDQALWSYLTVQQFSKRHQAFTTGMLRSLIFNEHHNGLTSFNAVVRIGRKVLINESNFFTWVESRNGARQS